MGRPTIDISGQRFGSWLVIRRDGYLYQTHAAFLCQCNCGTEKKVQGASLRKGGSLDCGCERSKRLGNRVRTHGMHMHPIYKSWQAMHARCTYRKHPAYARYKDLGICKEWYVFAKFQSDMSDMWFKGSTLERIDNEAGYQLGNCRWATRREQANNRKNTVYLEHNGDRMPLTYWAERVGITANALRLRLLKGWTLSDALYIVPSK